MSIIIFIIVLVVLILVHEFGHFISAKRSGIRVDEFGIGFPPKIIGKKVGETEYSINLLPLGGFVKIYGEHDTEITEADKNRAFYNQPAWKRSVVLLAGVTMNILLGWLVLTTIFTTGVPEHLMITQVAKDSPAMQAEIKQSDIILEASAGSTTLTDPIATEELIQLTKSNPAEILSLQIQRGKETVNTSAFIRPDPPEGQGAIGIAMVEIGFPKAPFPQNIIDGTISTGRTLKLITVSFFQLIIGIFTQPEILEGVAGPVGILSIATSAGNIGIVYLAQLMALISLNLAVLNLIPFPALDGGQFLMVLVEKITGKTIPIKAKIITNTIGMGVLLLLMVLVTIKDVGRLIN